jgi:predicted nicotinamide N-methyase
MLSIEEAHELETGRKHYVLRYELGRHNVRHAEVNATVKDDGAGGGGDDDDDHDDDHDHDHDHDDPTDRTASPIMGPIVSHIELQQIITMRHPAKEVNEQRPTCHNKQRSSSQASSLPSVLADPTGAMTWESAMVMAMYFAANPGELSGHVLELGSGLGLGGILLLDCFHQQRSSCAFSPSNSMGIQSLTMTDGNDRVVHQCRDNVTRAASGMLGLSATVPVTVKKLDWNNACSKAGCVQQPSRHSSTYDTILASDCVYRRDDVAVLAGTMKAMLKPLGTAKIHAFSPLNRSALPDFVEALKSLGMHVVLETVVLQRSRLRGPSSQIVMDGWSSLPQGQHSREEPWCASKDVSTFTHMTASYLSKPSNSWQEID